MDWDRMNEGMDQVSLPAPERRMIDKRHFMEVSYKQHDDGKIERLCRRGEVTKKEKKISRAAIERQKNFVKFGAVQGKIGKEKGITETRAEEFTVIWEGLSKHEQKMQAQEAARKNMERQNAVRDKESDSKIQELAISNQRIQPSSSNTVDNKRRGGGGGYVAPGLRNKGDAGFKPSYEEEEQFEIRISNLPKLTQQDDVKNIMYSLFDNEYHSKPYQEKRDIPSPPNRLKVYCFETRIEKEMNAIVDVKSKYWQTKAIELLDGQAYGYCIMKVEKSKPRKRRY